MKPDADSFSSFQKLCSENNQTIGVRQGWYHSTQPQSLCPGSDLWLMPASTESFSAWCLLVSSCRRSLCTVFMTSLQSYSLRTSAACPAACSCSSPTCLLVTGSAVQSKQPQVQKPMHGGSMQHQIWINFAHQEPQAVSNREAAEETYRDTQIHREQVKGWHTKNVQTNEQTDKNDQ